MRFRLFIASLLLMGSFGLAYSLSDRLPETVPTNQEVTAEDPFTLMMNVLTHKRCVNCHPNGDRPRQGEDSHYHNFGVVRGPDNHGLEGLTCNTCHQSENDDFSGVPGAPEWSLAPIEMYWEGLSRTEIAHSMLDPERNGGRNLKELVKHLTEHELVLWAWEPGVNSEGIPREPPPVSKEKYIEAVKAWAEAGAVVPAE
ncbi:hypothetical protein [Lewinella sp. W8]|uniref:hypothetical protein n=1 Tax=Lewinella sp. W8 TaxID=2528208 RepID=UPI001C12B13D|nr:hypothetical protein [Lewinella sp. W8]